MNLLTLFDRHLNWTYSCGIIVSIAIPVVALLVLGHSELLDRMRTETAENYGLHLFLDPAYSREWSGNDCPDVDELEWTDDSSDWAEAVLTIYLDNPTAYPLTVKATNYGQSYVVTDAFEVSSELYRVAPYSRSPMDIELRESRLYSYGGQLSVGSRSNRTPRR